jgi:hypothetical protein
VIGIADAVQLWRTDAAFPAFERHRRGGVRHGRFIGLLSAAAGDGRSCPACRTYGVAATAAAGLRAADCDDPVLSACTRGCGGTVRADAIAGNRVEQSRYDRCQCRPVRPTPASTGDAASAALPNGGLATGSLDLEWRTICLAQWTVWGASGSDRELDPRLLAARTYRVDLGRRPLGLGRLSPFSTLAAGAFFANSAISQIRVRDARASRSPADRRNRCARQSLRRSRGRRSALRAATPLR